MKPSHQTYTLSEIESIGRPVVSNSKKGLPGMLITSLAMMLTLLSMATSLFAQWNTNTSVNLLISNLPTADMQSVATTDGKMWVAFYHQNGGNYDMRAQLIDANGYKLLGPDGILVGNQTSGTATFVFNVCIDGANNLVIGYQYEVGGNLNAVVSKVSQSGTLMWGASGIVLGQGLAPNPTVLTTGETVVVWNESLSNTLNMQKITTSGTTAWTTPIQLKVGSSKTTRGQPITNTGGKFTVVYQKSGTGISTTLYAQAFNPAGTALYAPLMICNQTTSGARYYSIKAEGDTTYFGYYSSLGMRFNSFTQRINPDGTLPWGVNGSNFNTSTSTNDPYQGTTAIELTPGSPYIWSVCTFSNPNQTQYGIYIQKFLKSSGARQFTDAGKVVIGISNSGDTQAGELVLVDDTPMFMMYNSTDKIYATRLDASGSYAWPWTRIEMSSTTAPAGTPKMRFCFTSDGPNRCSGVWTENRDGQYMGYAQGVSVGGLIGIVVATEGGNPPEITTNHGTLQMTATIYPTLSSQAVTWSIVPGTGQATISTTGLVTAVGNGTVWAKAAAVQDPTVKDSLMITISGQAVINPVVTTLPASNVSLGSAKLNGSVTANTYATTVSFEWGPTIAYGNTVSATPATVSGNSATQVVGTVTGLSLGINYHYRCVGVNNAGTFYGNDETFSLEVGQQDLQTGRWSVTPNPGNGIFRISGTDISVKSVNVAIYDESGRQITRGDANSTGGKVQLDFDLSATPAGVYQAVIRGAGFSVSRKVLIRR